MISFREFSPEPITEGVKNFIGAKSRPEREIWGDRVWDVLEQTYSKIGGIAGNGLRSKQDMIENIPFWKIITEGEKVLAIRLYKDSAGRKSVAIATDGSDRAKKLLVKMIKADLGVAFGEISGGILAFTMKMLPFEVIQPFILDPREFAKRFSEKKVILPNEDMVAAKLERGDRAVWAKFPQLHPYFYIRELGGKLRLKLAIGTPDIPVT